MSWGRSLVVSTTEATFKKSKALDADAENKLSALMKAGAELPRGDDEKDLSPARRDELPHDDNARDLPPARMNELPHADNARDLPPARIAEVPHNDKARDLPPARMVGLPYGDNARDFLQGWLGCRITTTREIFHR
jgi:hypothetical protein